MKICPQCKHQNQARQNFVITAEPNSNPPKRSAERRQLTMLFCDLVDSTALSERLDPEEYRQVITNYHQVAEEVFNQHKGHVAQYMGDGLLVYFGYPVGLEDAPRVAVRAGLGVLSELEQANKEWMAAGNPEVKVRIGVHTGLAVVDEHLALGESVNIAAPPGRLGAPQWVGD